MAIYIGYVTIPIGSYDEFKTAVNGNGYNYDNTYGCQCYDLAVEFWHNVGFPNGYPHITNSSAYTMWNLREENISYGGVVYFDLVYDLNDVKRGDMLVYAGSTANPYGHNGWADEDYATWHQDNPTSTEFPILSQNNGGTPVAQGGSTANIHGYDTRLFLGAFRLKAWTPTPPPPPPSHSHKRFPFFIYAEKRRQNMLK